MKDEQEISLSIEETNKLRISLGLKPLEQESKESQEVKNYESFVRDQKAKEPQIKVQEEKVFKGKSLGQGDDLTTEEWVSRLKTKKPKGKKQKRIEKEYSVEELEGLKVAHDIDSLDHETILVLKDTSVLEDGGDELVNMSLLDKQKTDQILKFKKGNKKYNPYEEFERQQMGLEKRILAHYDDDDQPQGFVLSKSGIVDTLMDEKNRDNEMTEKGAISLTYDKTTQLQDYYTQEEFRKPKKKRKSSRRKNLDLDLDVEDQMNEDKVYEKYENSNKVSEIKTMNFVDDDDLQQALALVRNKSNKKILSNPVELKLKMMEEGNDEGSENGYDGLVISEVSEFVSSIGVQEVVDDDVQMESETTPSIAQDIKSQPKAESKTDSQIHQDVSQTQADGQIDQDVSMDIDEEQNVILEEEPLVGDGLAATLKLLQRKGDLESLTDEQQRREFVLKERAKWLSEQKVRTAHRLRELEEEKESLKGKKMGKQEMERRQREVEREEFKIAQEKFKDYQPAIELTYRDEVGRVLDPKQAFKEMSHKFHGKKMGKNKLEKHLKRMGDEIRLKQEIASGTMVGTTDRLVEKSKEMGQAHITLSVGEKPVLHELKALPPSIPTPIATKASIPKPVQKVRKKSVPLPMVQEVKQNTFEEIKEPEVVEIQNRPKIAFGLSTKRKLK